MPSVHRFICVASAVVLATGHAESLPTRKIDLSPVERTKAIAERGLAPDEIPDPLRLSDETRETARTVAGRGDPVDRLSRLQQYLFDDRTFVFDYDSRTTLTATEAFEQRRGNCVSFTNLFIALGRALELPVQIANVSVREEVELRGDLTLVSSHVVAAYRDGGSVVTFDFDRRREGPPMGVTLLGDLWIDAIYLNNKGVEELLLDRPETAAARFETAVGLVPEFAEAWGNLGVARRRVGNIPGAFDAYLLALQVEPRNMSVRGNLGRLYGALALERRGSDAGAADSDCPIEGVDRLLAIGDELLSRAMIKSGSKSYREAHRLAPGCVEPLVALARAQLYLGKPQAAGKQIGRALEIDPDNVEAVNLSDSIRRAGYD